MPHNVQRFGSVTVARARRSVDLKQLFEDPLLKTDTIVIKPNWVGTDRSYGFTECDALRMLLEALDHRIVVTESYNLGRGPPDSGMKFTVDGQEVNWRWLFMGKGWKWLEKNPGWDWFREGGHWDLIRKHDKWFLDEYGFTDLFNEHGVEYVNVTEEVWQGRVTDPREIKNAVENKFLPVFKEELCGCIPKKLYELRGATFISFAKLKKPYKDIVSFTLKNFFGLLPDPLRAWWHQWFDSSLVNTIKIYSSLFNVYGICEGIHYVPWWEKNKKILKDLGIVAFGRHLVSVDAVLCGLVGVDLEKVSYIKVAEETFGAYDRRHVEEAKAAGADWFPS